MDKLETFIEKSRKRHGDKYDYSKVQYVDSLTKVCIVCPEHGEFWQTPQGHVRGYECPECAKKRQGKRSNVDEFIAKAKEVHGEKYDYSKVNYVNAMTKVTIICPTHGEFEMIPMNHIMGQGCPKCHGRGLTQEEVIERFKEVHGDKYDYSQVVFTKMHEKVKIICPKHGEFYQTPAKHYSHKQGCPKCGKEERKLKRLKNTERFIEEARKTHGDKYDYSKTVYNGAHSKVRVICPVHGEFLQRADGHLQGHGCYLCNSSRLEERVKLLLDENKIEYIEQCRRNTLAWLERLTLDFYLPKYNIAIECQGEQHFEEVEYFGGKEEFEKILERDNRKKKLCEDNGVKLLYFGNTSNENNVITEEKVLLNKILL